MPAKPCPYLGLDDDQTTSRTLPSPAHRCYARQPAVAVDAKTQTDLCLSGGYAACSYCLDASPSLASPAPAIWLDAAASQSSTLDLPPPKWAVNQQPMAASLSTSSEPQWGAALPLASANTVETASNQEAGDGAGTQRLLRLWLLLPLAAIVVFAALVVVIGNAWLQPPTVVTAPDGGVGLPVAAAASKTAQPSMETEVVAISSPETRQAPPATVDPTAASNREGTSLDLISTTPQPSAITAESVPALSDRFATPTPIAGGKVVTVKPNAGDAGWWSSDEQRGHLGDSFLYAGRYAGQEFLSAVGFDLARIPRGAALNEVILRLNGLKADRLSVPGDVQGAGNAETIWLVQLVGEANAPDLPRSNYLTALSAPAAVTLPPLHADHLAAGNTNTFELDDASRSWLETELLNGATSVLVRLIASGGTGDTMFAWDSGQGPESAGGSPELIVSYGPPPPTPPPLPTKPFVVATLTPVPVNALTVVAQAATATAEAALVGTATPLPYQVYTPTPIPENLETVQAVAAIKGLPAVLLLTPTPANAATATEQAAYATAVALTTGTFTPVPTGFVTPIVVPPSPPAQNVATAAARVLAATATAGAPSNGQLPTVTPTPLPFNAVLGIYVFATPVFVPTNEATAVAYNKLLNDAIVATGTPTPLPWNAIVITVVPTPVPPTLTPIPLFIPASDLTATPTPTPTGTPPAELPPEAHGKILFKSDRGGGEAVYMLDPASGDVTLITQPWVFNLAQEQLALSPDGANRALVRQDDNGNLQIYGESLQYGTVRKITALGGNNYDPAWSPTGEWIAIVNTETGGDEIYRVDPSGAVAQRLTVNTWEWDKHPSWSPDGTQIVFYSNREAGRRQLWIMNVDGSNQRNLSSNSYNDWDPIWVR